MRPMHAKMLLLYEVFSNTMQRHDDGMPKLKGLVAGQKTRIACLDTHSHDNCKEWLIQVAIVFQHSSSCQSNLDSTVC